MAEFIRIDNLDRPELAIYSNQNEAQLRHYYEPEEGIFIAESPNVIARALDAGYEPISFLAEPSQAEGPAAEDIARCGDIPVYIGSNELLSKITGFKLARGALCAMRRRPLPDIEALLQGAHRIVILEDVVNPTNVGALFRSAAALSMDAILLTPDCADPLYRRADRVSMGTVFQIPWTYFDSPWHVERRETEDDVEKRKAEESRLWIWPDQAMNFLHAHGFKTVAMALRNNSVDIDDKILRAEDRLAVVMGTEGEGLTPRTIEMCDYCVTIPMKNGVDSLNVAAAGAIAFWELGPRGRIRNNV